MKFQFEGYIYPDETKDYIEIDFDFLGKSEFIKALDPDVSRPILIPERFSNYQIDEFKEILEKITNKEELTEEDKHLCKSKVLKPLFEFFMMNSEFIKILDAIPENKIYYMVQEIAYEYEEMEHLPEVENAKRSIRNFDEIYLSREDAIKGLRNKLYETCRNDNYYGSNGNPVRIDKEEKILYLPCDNIESRYTLDDDEFSFTHLELYYTYVLRIIEINLENITTKPNKYDDYKLEMYEPDNDVFDEDVKEVEDDDEDNDG
jgi:hypothetical protein